MVFAGAWFARSDAASEAAGCDRPVFVWAVVVVVEGAGAAELSSESPARAVCLRQALVLVSACVSDRLLPPCFACLPLTGCGGRCFVGRCGVAARPFLGLVLKSAGVGGAYEAVVGVGSASMVAEDAAHTACFVGRERYGGDVVVVTVWSAADAAVRASGVGSDAVLRPSASVAAPAVYRATA